MRTLKLTIEYDGTDYSGWQIQRGQATIQGTIQDVLRRILKEDVDLIGASRTDAGVHAWGQVAHCKTASQIPCKRILASLRGLLPPTIAVRDIRPVSAKFHAQKSAKKKTYVYLVWNHTIPSALLQHRAWTVWQPLNLSEMRKAAKHLVGRHDFAAFQGGDREVRKTSVRKIYDINIRRMKNFPLLKIAITGNGFLKYMIRNLAGTLTEVGRGRTSSDRFFEILKSKDRKKAGITAPAYGLYLVSVHF
jgi:tRNA pseudouridine38-40 synthase